MHHLYKLNKLEELEASGDAVEVVQPLHAPVRRGNLVTHDVEEKPQGSLDDLRTTISSLQLLALRAHLSPELASSANLGAHPSA